MSGIAEDWLPKHFILLEEGEIKAFLLDNGQAKFFDTKEQAVECAQAKGLREYEIVVRWVCFDLSKT